MSAAKAVYADRNGHAPEPRKPSIKIVCKDPKRGSHQEFWPEVEASTTVTIVKPETWGTDSVTYEIVARRVVDIRNGHTSGAFEEAERLALHTACSMADQIRLDNPHPRA
jgi:hypothetical protein